MNLIKTMALSVLAMLAFSCSNESEDVQMCTGHKVESFKWCEYRYMLNGELVRAFTDGLTIKMHGDRPVVYYTKTNTPAEKHVYVIQESKTVGNDLVSFDCNKREISSWNNIKEWEEKKDYTYIFKGWTQSDVYYE